MDEINRALGRIEGRVGEIRQAVQDVKAGQDEMAKRVGRLEARIYGISSAVAMASALVVAKAKLWLGMD